METHLKGSYPRSSSFFVLRQKGYESHVRRNGLCFNYYKLQHDSTTPLQNIAKVFEVFERFGGCFSTNYKSFGDHVFFHMSSTRRSQLLQQGTCLCQSYS